MSSPEEGGSPAPSRRRGPGRMSKEDCQKEMKKASGSDSNSEDDSGQKKENDDSYVDDLLDGDSEDEIEVLNTSEQREETPPSSVVLLNMVGMRPSSESDSDIEIIDAANIEEKIIPKKYFNCEFPGCSHKTVEEKYKDHLSNHHFLIDLKGLVVKKSTGGSNTYHCYLPDCPESVSGSNSISDVAVHIGVVHEEAVKLMTKRLRNAMRTGRKVGRKTEKSISSDRGRTPSTSRRNKSASEREEKKDKINPFIKVKEEICYNDSGSSEVEIMEEKCFVCYHMVDNIDSHYANVHFQKRFEEELRAAGFKSDCIVSKTGSCPICLTLQTDILTHWGTHHQGNRRALERAKGVIESFVGMKSANETVVEHLQKTSGQIFVDIPQSNIITAITSKMQQFKTKISYNEEVSLEMDVVEESVSDDSENADNTRETEQTDGEPDIAIVLNGAEIVSSDETSIITGVNLDVQLGQEKDIISGSFSNSVSNLGKPVNIRESRQIKQQTASTQEDRLNMSSSPSVQEQVEGCKDATSEENILNSVATEGSKARSTGATGEKVGIIDKNNSKQPTAATLKFDTHTTTKEFFVEKLAEIKEVTMKSSDSCNKYGPGSDSKNRKEIMSSNETKEITGSIGKPLDAQELFTDIQPQLRTGSRASSDSVCGPQQDCMPPTHQPSQPLGNLDLGYMVESMLKGKIEPQVVTVLLPTARDEIIQTKNIQHQSRKPLSETSSSTKPDIAGDRKPVHFSSENSLKCQVCRISCPTEKDLNIHLCADHFKNELIQNLGLSSCTADTPLKCPLCLYTVSKNGSVDVLIFHYGQHFSVQTLYDKHLEEKTENCVFCMKSFSAQEDFLEHIVQTHLSEVNSSVGLMWLYEKRAENKFACPTCKQVLPLENITKHYILEHRTEFLKCLSEYKTKCTVSKQCLFCRLEFPTTKLYLNHLSTQHFQDDLLSECSRFTDSHFQCPYCNYKSESANNIVQHLGINHQRLKVYFSERVLRLLKSQELVMNGPVLEVDTLANYHYGKVADYMFATSLREELAVRDYVLNSQSEIYQDLYESLFKSEEGRYHCLSCNMSFQDETLAISHVGLAPHHRARDLTILRDVEQTRELTCKLCHINLGAKSELIEHLKSKHFFDDILLEGNLCESNQTDDDRYYQCEENCSNKDKMRPVDFVAHRTVIHDSALKHYNSIQVTTSMLNCKICKLKNFTNMAQMKEHLGVHHFRAELKTCFFTTADGSLCCSVCHYNASGQNQEERMTKHVATAHNFVEHLAAVVGSEQKTKYASFTCELCGYSTENLPGFMEHLTAQHYLPDGCQQIKNKCSICSKFFNGADYRQHVGIDLSECNLSLQNYFLQVDRLQPNPSAATWGKNLNRLKQASKKAASYHLDPTSLFKFTWGRVTDASWRDPLSASIRLGFSPDTGNLEVGFREKLPMKSFKAQQLFRHSDHSQGCFFCKLVNPASAVWFPPKGDKRQITDLYLIHLANEHFANVLKPMFAKPQGENMFMCCGDDYNYQNLIGHVKESHNIIQDMFDAIVPRNWTNPRERTSRPASGVEPPLLLYLMPWLQPISPIPDIVKSDNSNSQFACTLCSRLFPNSTHLNRHYISNHFLKDVEAKYIANSKVQPPFKCIYCPFETDGLKDENTPKLDYLAHLADQHSVLLPLIEKESLIDASVEDNSVGQDEKIAMIKEELDIAPVPASLYTSPRPYQCLVCQVVFLDIRSLSDHIKFEKHINISWAIDSNKLKEKTSLHYDSGSRGKWFQKLDKYYKCSFCLAASNIETLSKFESLDEVFYHIVTSHLEQFKEIYPTTVINFCLCKICNGYISFGCHEDQNSQKKIELEHYISHGRVILEEIGIMTPSLSSKSIICQFCTGSIKSYQEFKTHLQSEHLEELLIIYREFPMSKMSNSKPLDKCCICKESNTSLIHLSRHNKRILSDIGFLEAGFNNHKTSKITCKCCKDIFLNTHQVIDHFSRFHSNLFNLIATILSKNNIPMDLKTPTDSYYSSIELDPPSRPVMLPFSMKERISRENFLKKEVKEEPPLENSIKGKDSLAGLPVEEDVNLPDRIVISDTDNKHSDQKWDTILICCVCEKRLPTQKTQRQKHFLGHFSEDIADWINLKNSDYFEKSCCPTCQVECYKESSLILHMGTIHNLFDTFLQKVIDQKSKKMAKIIKHSSSFSDQFKKFVETESKAENLEEEIPERKECDPEAQVTSTEKCKVCDFVFVGVKEKPMRTRKLEKKTHYLPHFKDKLMEKNREAFELPLPLHCGKCDFVLTNKNTSDPIDAMLSHVASCCNELENMIAKFSLEGGKKSPDNKPASIVGRKVCTKNWRNSKTCVLCPETELLSTELTLQEHYVGHFKQELIRIFQDFFIPKQSSVLCPYPDCKLFPHREWPLGKDEPPSDLLIHIGFQHDFIQKWFFARQNMNIVFIPPSEHVLLDNILKNRFWAQIAHDCLICTVPLKRLDRDERTHHYASHFLLLDKVFGNPWKRVRVCFICKAEISTLKKLRCHMAVNHFDREIKTSLKFKKDGTFQCNHCTYRVTNMDSICEHLVNEEFMLDVYLLAYMRRNKIKSGAIYQEFPTVDMHLNIDVEVEKQREEIIDQHLDVHDEDSITDDYCDMSDVGLTTIGMKVENSMDDDKEKDDELDQEELDYVAKVNSVLEWAKRNQKPFVQHAPCYRIDQNLSPCHECKKIKEGANYALSGTCCCFEGFRKLRFTSSGKLLKVGYLTKSDAKPRDLEIWSPNYSHKEMEESVSYFILEKLGDIFCNMITEENDLSEEFSANDRQIIWKRPHQGVREMCDICSTSIFNHHFTCSTCGLSVCCDCFLARKKGTKYQTSGAMCNPYRKRKRFSPDLDCNLWPLCLQSKMHDLDKLVLTEMSPGSIPSQIKADIHSIRQYFQLSNDCNCCKKKESSAHQNSSLACSGFTFDVYSTCPKCKKSFDGFTLIAKKIHLSGHIKEKLSRGNVTNSCTECNITTGNADLMFAHRVLAHREVERHYSEEFLSNEREKLASSTLEIDSHTNCDVCDVTLPVETDQKRKHYVHHLSDTLLDSVSSEYPYKCENEDCDTVEFSRSRLMFHIAIVHKMIDKSLKEFGVYVPDKQVKSKPWIEKHSCLVCSRDLDTISQKRIHYLKHYKADVSKEINFRFNDILLKDGPFKCMESGCKFTDDSKTKLVQHMACKHTMIDAIIERNSDQDSIFSGPCRICPEAVFNLEDKGDNLKYAKSHYFGHFRERLEKEFKTTLSQSNIPLNCQIEECQFSTFKVKSQGIGFHKRKLLFHLGYDHKIIKTYMQNPKEIVHTMTVNEKKDTRKLCPICTEPLPNAVNFQHFKKDLKREYPNSIVNAPNYSCSQCDFSLHHSPHSDAFRILRNQLATKHGVYKKLIQDYTQSIDYEKEDKCRICRSDFQKSSSKRDDVIEHYGEHFVGAFDQEEILKRECPFCGKTYEQVLQLVSHLGTSHGFFCRFLKEMQLWNEDEDSHAMKDISDSEIMKLNNTCVLCGKTVVSSESSSKTVYREHMLSHLPANCGIENKVIPLQQSDMLLNKMFTALESKMSQDFEDFFLPQGVFSDDCILVDQPADIPKDNSVDDVPEQFQNVFKDDGFSDDAQNSPESIKEESPIPDIGTKNPKENHVDVVIERMSECPFCKNADFTQVDELTVRMHLIRHFSKKLVEDLPLTAPLKCPVCADNFENRESLLFHYGICHKILENIVEKEIGKNVLSISVKDERQVDSYKISRYTLPQNRERYKSLCLICGHTITLASTDKLKSLECADKHQVLCDDLGLHLLSKHVKEYFPELTDECRACYVCHEIFSNVTDIKKHFVRRHRDYVISVINTIFKLKSSDKTIFFENCFIGLDVSFVDVIELDTISLETVGLLSEPLSVTDLGKCDLISLTNVTLLHKHEDEWTCELCHENIGGTSKNTRFNSFVKHFVQHFDAVSSKYSQTKNSISFTCNQCNSQFRTAYSILHHLAFFHSNFDQELRSQLMVNPDCLRLLWVRLRKYLDWKKSSNKRIHQDSSNENPTKKIKTFLCENSLVVKETVFECEICSVLLPRSEEKRHIFLHMKADIPVGPEHKCFICTHDFENSLEVTEHIGMMHDWCSEQYQMLTFDEKKQKEDIFFHELSQKIPRECIICCYAKYTLKKGHSLVFGYMDHISNEHLSEAFLKKCDICNISLTTKRSLFHFFLEHPEVLEKALYCVLEKDWKGLGGQQCELCEETTSFTNPHLKRKHLSKVHFKDEMNKKLDDLKCPNRNNFLGKGKEVKHYDVAVNKNVDEYFQKFIKDHKKLNIQETIVCPMCFSLIDSSQQLSHIESHFFASEIAPIISSEVCPQPNCSDPIEARNKDSVYGVLSVHLAKKHFSCTTVRFLSTFHTWIKEPEALTNIQFRLNSLLLNKICILCETEVSESILQHLKDHFRNQLINKHKAEANSECALCDGFPSFPCVNELVNHILQKHFQQELEDYLKSFAALDRLESCRTTVSEGCSLNSFPGKVEDCKRLSLLPFSRKRRHNSSDTLSSVSSCTSSRSSSPTNVRWLPSRGSRPPLGITSETEEAFFEGKEWCEFGNCDGYLQDDFYPHLAGHFHPLLLADMGRERQLAGKLEDWDPLQCVRCVFRGDDMHDLLVHYGEYHKVLDYYLEAAWDPQLSERLRSLNDGTCKPLQLHSQICHWCGHKPPTGRHLSSLHILHHIRESSSHLPKTQPFVCPHCFYEASSRARLMKHAWELHPLVMEARARRPDFSWRKLAPREEIDFKDDDTMMFVRCDYNKASPVSSNQSTGNRDLVTDRNYLKTFIDSLQLTDDNEVDEGESDSSMSAQISRWCSEIGVKPGTRLVYPELEAMETDEVKGGRENSGLKTLACRHTLSVQESARMFPETPHSWLCDGRLLHLYDAISPHNLPLFQYQWARGQPVIISRSNQYLNKRLWHPDAFKKDFGHVRSDLINTLTGKTVPKQPLKWFWEGFSSVSHRIPDSKGTPMLLKLKDWPPDGDIADYIPKRFNDLINDFPIQPYTLREGSLNLASYIPDYFLKPELGPKMYIAYGNSLYSDRASTNLHLDMSDAVNLLVYVGLPEDSNAQENIKLVLQQVDEAGCDLITKRRVREEGQLPGAVWHIFHPGDTNKIRDLLNKVAIEKGKRLDPHDDPIHDQSTYLDAQLRLRLYKEYGVEGYAIIQCAGDTVFIPAGACHQVRNLHNCIKIAEDFVSPELADNCLHLTQEFRQLTEHHTNHEDKLQIKSIIYHSVKNAVSVLNRKMKREKEEKISVE